MIPRVPAFDFAACHLYAQKSMTLALRGSRLIAVVAAALVLLTAIAIPALPLLHGLNDDPCNPGVANHDSAAHQIGADRTPATSPHCSICHWWQSAGRFGGPHFQSTTLTTLADLGLVEKATVTGPTLLVVSERPARAPPSV